MTENFSDWVGRQETASDLTSVSPLAGLSATLDYARGEEPWVASEVPPLGHWLYFLPRTRQRDIGLDGHPERGGFLPPISLPRRMWAGSQIYFAKPLPTGAQATRVSTIRSVEAKSGRLGELVFVTVEHVITVAGETESAIVETQDIVYRGAALAGNASPSVQALVPTPRDHDWSRQMKVDPALLFRYSALTFNAHRIHYDRDYCRDVEGYEGLVVHGPLSATLLIDFFLREFPGTHVSRFEFRAKRPILDFRLFSLCGKRTPSGADLWILDADGYEAMTAELDAK